MTGQTVTDATKKQEAGALAVLDAHRSGLVARLPSHIKPAGWYASATAALRKDKDLYSAANRNPGSLMNALHHAARLGLEPGTEQFYLTWRRSKNAPGGVEVQGMPGYQGEVELIYRAGAASSVIVEVVRKNDLFVWAPGRLDDQQPPRWDGLMARPYHAPDWFGDRGDVIGAYAYAIMRDGAVSKVVVIGQERIDRAIAASPTANSSHSPWKTDYAAMVLKTAAHDLHKWVPTSSEYIREQLRATRDVAAEDTAGTSLPPEPEPTTYVDGQDVVDAEIVDDEMDPGMWHDKGHPAGDQIRAWAQDCHICAEDAVGRMHDTEHTGSDVAGCAYCQKETALRTAASR